MIFVGTGDGENGRPGLHHPEFLPSDDLLSDVAVAYLAGYRAAAAMINAVRSTGTPSQPDLLHEHLQ